MAEKKWPPVEMVRDITDDPPRPFLAKELDPEGAWREDDDYRTETYVPLSALEDPEVVELAARADYGDESPPWDQLGSAEQDEFRAAARRSLQAIRQPLAGEQR